MIRALLRTAGLGILFATQLTTAHAAPHSIGKYKVEFTDEQGFTPVEGLWGVGFSLVSNLDDKTGLRTSIGVFDMEVNDVHFDYPTLEKNVDDYYQGRKAWLGKLDGAKWMKSLPMERVKNEANKVDGYRVGFEYELGGVAQIQYSYYVMCDKRMFHLKTLYSAEAEAKASSDLNRIIKTFRCESDSEKVGNFAVADIREHWKTVNAKPEAREEVAAALRDFLIDYEQAHQKDDDGSQSRLDPIRTFIEQYLTPTSAYAGTNGCFFAGWESQWTTVNGKATCELPPEAAAQCGTGQIGCNPGVFGKVCISDEFKQTATQVCNAEYKREQLKHDGEIKTYLTDHPEVAGSLEKGIDDVCSSPAYRNSNYGLCTTLYDRVGKIAGGEHPLKKLSNPLGADPTQFQKAYDLTQDQMRLFENFCMTADQKMIPSAVVQGKTIDCVAVKKQILTNLRELDKVDAKTNFKAIQNSCETGPGAQLKGTMAALQKQSNSCTKAEEAAANHCGEDIMCSALASAVPNGLAMILPKVNVGSCNIAQDGCLQHAANGIMEALWGTVKGLYDMAKGAIGGILSDTGKGMKNLAKGTLNFFGASYKIDDASSYKVVQLAKTGNGMLANFLKDPKKAISDFFSGIWSGISSWMMGDVFCEQWSGMPHLSKCLVPASGWKCLSCKQKMNGTCTAVGYVASEIVGTLLTGGAKGIIDSAGVTAKVASLLEKAGEVGKLKYAKFAEEYPNLAKVASAGRRAAEVTADAAGAVYRTGKNVIGFPLKVLSGKTRQVIEYLDKIPLVNIPIKAVKLSATQARNFGKWYGELSEKAFAVGENAGRGLVSDISAAKNASKLIAVQEANRLAEEARLGVQANGQFDRAVNNIANGKSYTPKIKSDFTQATAAADKEVIPNLIKQVEQSSQGKAKLEVLDDHHLKLTRATDAGTETKLVVVGPDGSLNVGEMPKDFRRTNLREPAGVPPSKHRFLVEEENSVAVTPGQKLAQKEADRVVQSVADQKATQQAMRQFDNGVKNLAEGKTYVPSVKSEYTAAAKELDPNLIPNLAHKVETVSGGKSQLQVIEGRYLKLTTTEANGAKLDMLVVVGEDGSLRVSEMPKGFEKRFQKPAVKPVKDVQAFDPDREARFEANAQAVDLQRDGANPAVVPGAKPAAAPGPKPQKFLVSEGSKPIIIETDKKPGLDFSEGKKITTSDRQNAQILHFNSEGKLEAKPQKFVVSEEGKPVSGESDLVEKVNPNSAVMKNPRNKPANRSVSSLPREKVIETYQTKLEQMAPIYDTGLVYKDSYISNGYWRQWNGGGIDHLPAQGWKLHVGATPESAQKIAEALLPMLKEQNIAHKVVDNLAGFASTEGTQAGKFITIYPKTDAEAKMISDKIAQILKKKNFKPGDFVRPTGEDPAGLGVFARYGRFTGDNLVDEAGNAIAGTNKKLFVNGKIVDDVRGQSRPDGIAPLFGDGF